MLSWLPLVSAAPSGTLPFPNPTFKSFSDFILTHFNSNISLTTTLLILLSLVNNPEVLNLHARQKHPAFADENKTSMSGWLKTLARGISMRLDSDLSLVLKPKERTDAQMTTDFTKNLDELCTFLALTPYTSRYFQQKINKVSQKCLIPIKIICPPNMTCINGNCQPYHLLASTRVRDIALVSLIQGGIVNKWAFPIKGECPKCKTQYHADHESFKLPDSNKQRKTILNSASFLKIGSNLWVDRVFSKAVLSGIYNFHSSATAYCSFWNDSFGNVSHPIELSRKHIWQAFVQESIRMVGDTSNTPLEVDLNIEIQEVSLFYNLLFVSLVLKNL